jgi:hypothetical protein
MDGFGLVLLLVGAFAMVGAPLALARLRGPFVLRAVRVGGVVYAVLSVIVTAFTVIPLIAGGPSVVSVPLLVHRLLRPSGVMFETGPTATVTDGGVDRATLTLTGLGVPTRVLLICAALSVAAVSIVIAVALAQIAAAALRGEPFVPAAARSVTVVAVAIAVGGTLSAVLQQWGEWSAGRDALFVTAWGSASISGPGTTLADLGWPDPAYFALQIPFLPLLLGLGLTAIAAVFRAGERLQRDTEGLV